jgi:Icc-related predicted phosphoesterase
MKILSLSDKVVPFLYSPTVKKRYGHVDIILGCGDLSYFYLEYIMNALNKPLLYVRGNHDKIAEYSGRVMRTHPHGGIDLHRRVIHLNGYLLAGVEGCLRYRSGHYQYSQNEMWGHVFSLVPKMIYYRALTGRYLDILVTHAPPETIHDSDDLPHMGISAFRWLLNVFRPAYHVHGHIHRYNPEDERVTQYKNSCVINTYPYFDFDSTMKERGADLCQ